MFCLDYETLIEMSEPQHHFLIDDIKKQMITLDDLVYVPSEGANVFSMPDESSWYPHKYPVFDPECSTLEDVCICIEKYIANGSTTAEIEAQKYLFFQKTMPLVYILHQYGDQIQDWNQLLATYVINCSDDKFFLLIVDAYYRQFAKVPSCDPEDNELLWLCLKVGNSNHITMLFQIQVIIYII